MSAAIPLYWRDRSGKNGKGAERNSNFSSKAIFLFSHLEIKNVNVVLTLMKKLRENAPNIILLPEDPIVFAPSLEQYNGLDGNDSCYEYSAKPCTIKRPQK